MGVFDLEDTEKYPSRGPTSSSEKDEEEEEESWGEAMTIANKDEKEYWQRVVDECFDDGEFSREGVEEASEFCAISFPDVIERLDTMGVMEFDEDEVLEEFDTGGTRWARTRFYDPPGEDNDAFLEGALTSGSSSLPSEETSGLKGLVNEKKNS